jgi:hypothetical protein
MSLNSFVVGFQPGPKVQAEIAAAFAVVLSGEAPDEVD